jgi:hypothetical protein
MKASYVVSIVIAATMHLASVEIMEAHGLDHSIYAMTSKFMLCVSGVIIAMRSAWK